MAVFLDAPLVIDLIELGDEESFESIKAICNDLKTLGAKICIFDHNAEECRTMVSYALANARNSLNIDHSVSKRLVYDRFGRTRAQTFLSNTTKFLDGNGIEVVKFRERYGDTYKFYIEKREEDLYSRVRKTGSVEGRMIDAKSVANIFRMIASQNKASTLFSLPALFISKNTTVVTNAIQAMRDDRLLGPEQAAPFATDRYMAGLLFVALGGKGEDLPKAKLVANCMAAISPRRDVVTRAYQVLSDLNDQRAAEFEALMNDGRCAHYLMDLSLGDAEAIRPDNALELLERLRLQAADEVRRNKDEEKARELAAQRAALEAQASAVSDHYKNEVNSLSKKFDKFQSEHLAVLDRMRDQESLIETLSREKMKLEKDSLQDCVKWVQMAGHAYVGIIYVFIACLTSMVAFIAASLWDLHQTLLWSGSTFFGSLILGLTQFWFVPEFLFGRLLRRAKERSLRRCATRKHLETFNVVYLVNVDTGEILER